MSIPTARKFEPRWRRSRVGKAFILTGLVLAGWGYFIPGAAAQGTEARAGVPVVGLVPDGLVLSDVSVPDGPGAVRLFLADARQGKDGPAAVSVEVLVADDLDGAREWVAFQESTVGATGLARVPGLGDHARGDDGLVLFRRANIGVRVQRMRPGHDARTIAGHVDGHILNAPPGTPDPDAVPELTLPPHLNDATRQDGDAIVRLSEGLLAARVQVEGPGYARKTSDGWRIVRTGPGPLQVSATRVDLKLVVAR